MKFSYKNKSEVIEAAKLFVCEDFNYESKKSKIYDQPDKAIDFLKLNHSMNKGYEVFSVMFLNSKNELLGFKELFTGSINSAQVYPRTVAKEALTHNAAAVILCHNHPSGDCNPSGADIDLTHELKKVLKLIDVKVLDHIIVSPTESHSMAAYLTL
jgi:DNA repair protein RadC